MSMQSSRDETTNSGERNVREKDFIYWDKNVMAKKMETRIHCVYVNIFFVGRHLYILKQ